MINLRYHIVSITAVFLALAIGIAMGTTFIDRATVSTLKARLDDLSRRIDQSQRENQALNAQVDNWSAIDEQFAADAAPLIRGTLDTVPVLVVATRGVDTDSIDGARDMLAAAGARVQGTLWLTDRLALDDAKEVDDLSGILHLAGAGADRLRAEVVVALDGVLTDSVPGSGSASGPGTGDADTVGSSVGPDGEAATNTSASSGASTTSTVSTAVDAREVLAQLIEKGFIDVDEYDGQSIDVATLPTEGTRYLAVSGPGAQVPDANLLMPLVEHLAGSAPAPTVVAAQATADGTAGDGSQRTVFVGPIRKHETLKDRVSTVDDLELSLGQVATVLALAAGGQGRVGHYGVGDGRQALFPSLAQG